MPNPSPAPSRPAPGGLGPALLAALSLLSAAAPLGTDMYLPALVAMAGDLGTTASAVQLTLTTFMAGMAVGQLLAGPVSDAVGRRGMLVGSSVAFLATSVACALAPSVGVLVAMRLLQGLAGGAGTVVARAVIPDVVHGRAAAKAYSLMMAINGIAPIVGPVIGGLIIPVAGWRGIFWTLALVNVAMILVSLFVVPETLPADRRSPGAVRGLLPGIAGALRVPRFVPLMLAFAVGFAVMFAYISGSPFVLQDQLGLSPQAYSLAFGFNGVLVVALSAVNAKLVDRIPAGRLLVAGLATALAASVGLLVNGLAGPTLAATLPLMAVAVASMGLVMGNATSLALEQVGARGAGVGAASGLLGFLQFTCAAAVSPLVGLGSNAALSMGVTMTVAGVFAVACALAGVRGGGAPSRRRVTLD
ncbi:multidrug effflux MFS transporter [Corynebacterium sp. 335C]